MFGYLCPDYQMLLIHVHFISNKDAHFENLTYIISALTL